MKCISRTMLPAIIALTACLLPATTAHALDATMARIKAIAESWPRAVVVEARADYLYVQFGTALLKFTDDAEFWFDPAAGVVHVRSASRLGRKDFEVNRQRIEAMRAQLSSG